MKLEVVILVILGAAIFSTFNYLDKVEEQKFYANATKELESGFVWSNLTYEDRIEVNAYIQKLIDENATRDGWGAKWLDGVMTEELKKLVFDKEKELSDKRYRKDMSATSNN